MKILRRLYSALISSAMIGSTGSGLIGCSSFASTNEPISVESGKSPKASFDVVPRATKTQDRVLVLLALSGGGSRAAYFSARTMLALEKLVGSDGHEINLLKEVDLISSVSGGSLAAAYYASSVDDTPTVNKPTLAGPEPVVSNLRRWNEASIDKVFQKNYIARWVGNWFWPTNLLKFWLTAFDRTDIMAQTMSDNLFDTRLTGRDLQMADLNPERPNLILNATVASHSIKGDPAIGNKSFGTVFTFTEEDFRDTLNSDVASYELGPAVMASSAFPGAFNFMTLTDYSEAHPSLFSKERRYLHLFDGGTFDNLGLRSISRVLLSNHARLIKQYDRIAVILVDAYRPSIGADPIRADPRGMMSYFVDFNFLDASDSLLEANRHALLLDYFGRSLGDQHDRATCRRQGLPDHACQTVDHIGWTTPEGFDVRDSLLEKLFFFHITFDAVSDPDLKAALQAIPTTFNLVAGDITRNGETVRIDEAQSIRDGVRDIFQQDGTAGNPEVRQCIDTLVAMIRNPAASPVPPEENAWCGTAWAAKKRLGNTPLPGY